MTLNGGYVKVGAVAENTIIRLTLFFTKREINSSGVHKSSRDEIHLVSLLNLWGIVFSDQGNDDNIVPEKRGKC